MTATALLAQKMGYAPSADWSTAKVLRIRLQSAAFWLMLLATGQLLLSRLGLLILGYISGVDAAGLYGAVLTVSEIGGFPPWRPRCFMLLQLPKPIVRVKAL